MVEEAADVPHPGVGDLCLVEASYGFFGRKLLEDAFDRLAQRVYVFDAFRVALEAFVAG